YQPDVVVDLQQPAPVEEPDEAEQPPASPRYYAGPYSASTPVITLSPPSSSTAIRISDDVAEPVPPLRLPGPRAGTRSSPPTPVKPPRHAQTLPLPMPTTRAPRPVRPQQTTLVQQPPPSQSGDESIQLALVLAFGNDKYSSALSLPLSPTQQRPYSTPPATQTTFGARSRSTTPPPRSAQSSPPNSPLSPRVTWSPPAQSRHPNEHFQARTPPPPLNLHFASDYADTTSPTSASSSGSGTQSSFRTSQSSARRSSYNLNSQPLRKPEGTLMVPIPLMLRPRPLWRATPRSALGSPAYAPAAHLVRRSTFIAAGLNMHSPVADMSALGVETRALMFGRDAGVVLPGFDV
ncbi:hypothetical protein EXIGLDRAFT_40370, partial [Exidia glandulosa HHB12029]